VYADGSKIPVAISGQKLKKPNQDKSFELEFEVTLMEENILNV